MLSVDTRIYFRNLTYQYTRRLDIEGVKKKLLNKAPVSWGRRASSNRQNPWFSPFRIFNLILETGCVYRVHEWGLAQFIYQGTLNFGFMVISLRYQTNNLVPSFILIVDDSDYFGLLVGRIERVESEMRNDGTLRPDNGKAPALACIPSRGKFASRVNVSG